MFTRKPFILLVLAVFLSHSGTGQVTAQVTTPQVPGQTTRVSVASDGTPGNGDSYLPAITPDGRYVAFTSSASNLVSDDTNDRSDVFVHDRVTGQTMRVSVASNGAQGNDSSRQPAITPDGRYVAFVSYASNLVSGDTNGKEDIFIHDRQTGQTTRESVASGGAQANEDAVEPAITPDGRYVAFNTEADNLVTGDLNNASDVFVHDRQTGQTTIISVTSGGAQGIWDSYSAAFSADGRYVVFTSENDLAGNASGDDRHIYVRDRTTGQVTRISVASNGAKGNNLSEFASISADGRYVAFTSFATNLVSDDTNNRTDVFVHDRQTGQTRRVSVASDGSQAVGTVDIYYEASLSWNGRYVAFYSTATNLTAGDTNNVADVFTHDLATGQTSRASVASDGAQANDVSGESYGKPSIADNGCVAFVSKATNLVGNDTNGGDDIFVHCLPGGDQFVYLPLVIR